MQIIEHSPGDIEILKQKIRSENDAKQRANKAANKGVRYFKILNRNFS